MAILIDTIFMCNSIDSGYSTLFLNTYSFIALLSPDWLCKKLLHRANPDKINGTQHCTYDFYELLHRSGLAFSRESKSYMPACISGSYTMAARCSLSMDWLSLLCWVFSPPSLFSLPDSVCCVSPIRCREVLSLICSWRSISALYVVAQLSALQYIIDTHTRDSEHINF